MPDEVMRVKIDGKEYHLEGQLTLGEQQVFKQVGGIRLGELEDAMVNGDPDTLVALVIIMRRRAGETCTIEDAQAVTDLEFIDEPKAGVDAGPPPAQVADSPPSEHGVTELPQRAATTPNDSGLRSSGTGSA